MTNPFAKIPLYILYRLSSAFSDRNLKLNVLGSFLSRKRFVFAGLEYQFTWINQMGWRKSDRLFRDFPSRNKVLNFI